MFCQGIIAQTMESAWSVFMSTVLNIYW